MTITAPAPPATPRTTGHGRGFWYVAFAFLVAMAFSTVPAPLFPVYQARDGFSTFMITVVFAAYAVGVATALVLAGHVSDWLGRRRVLVPALVLELVAAVLFLSGTDLTTLLVARFVNGLGVGMLTATATAALADLDALHRPGAGPRRFEVVSTTVNIGGLGAGALLTGVLAEWAPAPLRTSYVVFVALLAVAIAAVALTPETVERPAERPSYRPQRPRADHRDPRTWLAAVLSGFVAFGVFGLFTSVAPGFVAGSLHHPSRALAGLVVFSVFGSAALAQALSGGLSLDARRRSGLLAVATGLVLLTLGMHAASLGLFLLGGVVAGAGAGVLFKSAVATAAGLAAPAERGEALAGLFLVAYLGMSVPAIGVGLAVRSVSAVTAMSWLTLLLVALLAVVALLGRHRD